MFSTETRDFWHSPQGNSPWQRRAGAPFSHTACLRPPRSCSGSLHRPWLVKGWIPDAEVAPHPASNQEPAERGQSRGLMRRWSRRCCCSCCAPRSSDALTGWPERDAPGRAHGPPWKLLVWFLAPPSRCSHHSSDSRLGNKATCSR